MVDNPPPFILEESLRLCHSGDLGDFLIDGPVDFVGVPRFFLQGNFANAWSLDASDPKKWEYNDITKKFGPFYMFNLWPRVEQRKLILAKNMFFKKKNIIITKKTTRQEESPEKTKRKNKKKNCIFLSFFVFFACFSCWCVVFFMWCSCFVFVFFLILVFWFVFWFALVLFFIFLWNPISVLLD